ncbi:MAG: twin-arginine translocase TatA/TatE family subunit [Thermoguttaceae bacterium]
MGFGSPIHWLIIGAILLLFFGNRLPSVMRSLGQGVVEFKKGLAGIEDDIKSAGKIEEQPAKPQPTEAKTGESEPVQR